MTTWIILFIIGVFMVGVLTGMLFILLCDHKERKIQKEVAL